MKINPEKFALAVVSSSDPKLAVSQKLSLYEEAFNAASNYSVTSKEGSKIGFQSFDVSL